jgi:DNA-binding NarL/FixJ family response regulator
MDRSRLTINPTHNTLNPTAFCHQLGSSGFSERYMTPLSREVVHPRASSPRATCTRVLIGEETAIDCQLLGDALKRCRLGRVTVHCAITTKQILKAAADNVIDIALISEDLQDGAYKGIQVVEQLRVTHPNVRSILLVRNIRREVTLDAFRSGAKGVLCRKEPIEALLKCVRAVHEGQVWVDSDQLEVLLQALVAAKPMRVTNQQGVYLLTKREDEVASLVAEGMTNREVANRLGLSEHTISNYLFKIYEKLGLSRRVDFVLYLLSRQPQNDANRSTQDLPIQQRASSI